MPFTDILLGREATSLASLQGGLTASIFITHTGFAKGTYVFLKLGFKMGIFWGGSPSSSGNQKKKSVLANWEKGHTLLCGDGKQVPVACWFTGKKQVRD